MRRVMHRYPWSTSIVLCLASCGSMPDPGEAGIRPVTLRVVEGGSVRVEIAGEHFTTYHQAVGARTKPYCFPVYGAPASG